ncbi:glycerate kinase [Alienimonas sp. DA493]|uniref:glycerate kinase type-2 family protein n=1 Tax=Alienimonas sp. DA493 TaxID=3373605 RepID=UPI003754D2FD
MSFTPNREHAIAIWRAGVDAVASDRLVRDAVRVTGDTLHILDERFRPHEADRLIVVGAGKAGAGMAAGFAEAVAGSPWAERLTGWLNVPADCVRPVPGFTLHAGRPAGANEPRPEGVEGTRRILELVRGCGPRDLCVVLLSGGGSALLVAPAEGITLADKLAVTKRLASRGANITELNTVRKRLSAVKGGGLGRASGAGRTLCLAISDVIGDPLDVIASGPTVADHSTAADALAVLRRYCPDRSDLPEAVWRRIEAAEGEERTVPDSVRTEVIGSNANATGAARRAAMAYDYQVNRVGPASAGEAAEEGRKLLAWTHVAAGSGAACRISGGEPTVSLCENPGKGGRNQELVLAAVDAAWDIPGGLNGAVILSGGTDGEDGPTDAAGAVADDALIARAKALGLHPRPYLDRNDAYPFFEQTGGLLKTGPTHTNVMDLRVALAP